MNIKQRIISIRNAIRRHRDQRGDDRCWVDDYWVWGFLESTRPMVQKPSFEECMRRCKLYYDLRSSKEKFKVSKKVNKKFSDSDLGSMSDSDLMKELLRLEKIIRAHRDAGGKRTMEDDKLLYSSLPEEATADFSLPPREEFIGGIKTGSGCPNFWKSHEECPKEACNIHKWGPCK